jgi:hypothetical protein
MFVNQNLELIGEGLENLLKINKLTTDPLLGEDPPEFSLWKNIPKNHGNLLEHVLLSVIKKTNIWEGYHHTEEEFNFVKSLIKEEKDSALQIDTLVINRKLQIALFIECKRNLKQQPQGAKDKIQKYNEWCNKYSSEILTEIAMPGGECRFAVFDAYGPKTRIKKLDGIPILKPKDLGIFFPSFVVNLFALSEHCAKLRISEHFNLNLNNLPQSTIPKNYPFGNEVDLIEKQLVEFCSENEYSTYDDSLSYSNQERFLENLKRLEMGMKQLFY